MSKRFAIIAGIVLLGITALAVLVPVPHSDSVPMVGKTVEIQTRPVSAQTVAADNKVPEFYGDNVRSALFARPLPAETPAPTETTQTQPLSGPTIEVPPPDVFAEYVYTGTVTVDGQKHALLESSRTREGSYLLQGDSFLGATVAQVDDSAVTLNVHGKMRRIPKSTAYNVVPLNAQAPSSSDKNTQAPSNPGGSPVTALSFTNDQQSISEALQRAVSQGNFQATFSTGDGGGNTVIFSLGESD